MTTVFVSASVAPQTPWFWNDRAAPASASAPDTLLMARGGNLFELSDDGSVLELAVDFE